MNRFSTEDRVLLELCRNEIRLHVLQALLKERSFQLPALVATARRHNLAAYALDRLIALPGGFAWADALAPVAKREVLAALSSNLVFKRELIGILEALAGAGVEGILLKGLSLDFSGLRTIGDLDILVPGQDIVRAIEAVLALPGYSFRLRRHPHDIGGRMICSPMPRRDRARVLDQAEWSSEYQLYKTSLGVLVELHTRLLQTPPDSYSTAWRELALLQGNSDYFRRRKSFDPRLGCFVLSPEHSLLLMCLHTALKRSPGNDTFRLSNLVDIDCLVARGVDWEELLRASKRFQVSHLVLFALRLACRLLETPLPPEALRSLRAGSSWARRYAADLHLRSLRSLGGGSPLPSKLHAILTGYLNGRGFWDRLRWLFLLPIVLPSRWRIAQLFGIAPGSPLLGLAYLGNPVRWLWRAANRLGRR